MLFRISCSLLAAQVVVTDASLAAAISPKGPGGLPQQTAVTLCANDGSGLKQVEMVVCGSMMAEPAWIPVCKSGYTFGGWFCDPKGTNPFAFDRVIEGPLTLYADYSRDILLKDTGMVSRVTGATLPGETLPNPNQTHERYSLGGTDLGIVWELSEGRYGLFFGDSYGPDFRPVPTGGPGSAGDWRSNLLAFSEDVELNDGLTFSGMLTDSKHPKRASEIVPRLGDRLYTPIPTAAICLNGVQYMHYMYWQVGIDDAPENYSSIYCSYDGGYHWSCCKDRVVFGRASNFGMVGYAKHNGYCYMVGTRIGRTSSARLARFRYADVLNKENYEYWNGARRCWVKNDETMATVIIDGTVGELSVGYLKKYKRWLVLYFDAERYAICYRTAAQLNGQWSQERVLVSGHDYPQLYGSYLHPASMDSDTLFYTLSEWHPYNVFLMKAAVTFAEE